MKTVIRFAAIVLFLLPLTNSYAQKPVKIFLIGNSTMANKEYGKSNPEKGWGQVFPLYFKDNVVIENHARNGRSTKSFIDQGLWDTVINRLSSGDYLFIEFGHNDAKKEDPARYADAFGAYKTNLERFITEARQKGAIPVLLTPINRRKFDSTGIFVDTHGDYPKVVREISAAMNVPVLDLHKKSQDLLVLLGPEKSKKLYMYAEPGEFARFPEGKEDDTHFSGTGAFKVCDMVVEEMRVHVQALLPYLKDEK
jgi:lysophospholipase L1-like esterase